MKKHAARTATKAAALSALCCALMSASFVTAANEDSGWYVGGFFSEQEHMPRGRSHRLLGVTSGYQFNPFFALETRIATGVSGQSGPAYVGNQPGDERWSDDIDQQASLSLKAMYPVLDSLTLYGLAGYSYSRSELTLRAVTVQNDEIISDMMVNRSNYDSGLSYGVGVNVRVHQHVEVFVDYQRMPDFKIHGLSASWDNVTFGFNYRF